MIVIIYAKYKKNPSRTVDATERSNDLEDIGQGQRSSHATHLLMLVIICTKYGKNPFWTVDATGRTRKGNGQTDRQAESNIPPLTSLRGYNNLLVHFLGITLSLITVKLITENVPITYHIIWTTQHVVTVSLYTDAGRRHYPMQFWLFHHPQYKACALSCLCGWWTKQGVM